jgi:hypothetical protein
MRLDERLAKAFLGFLKRKNVALTKAGAALSDAEIQVLGKEFVDARSKESARPAARATRALARIGPRSPMRRPFPRGSPGRVAFILRWRPRKFSRLRTTTHRNGYDNPKGALDWHGLDGRAPSD